MPLPPVPVIEPLPAARPTPVMRPEALRVVMPERAPALVTSKLVESITSGADPPPMVMVPVLVPVLMLVGLLLLAFKLIVAPETVAPALAVSRLEKVLAPPRVWVVVEISPAFVPSATARFRVLPVMVAPLAVGVPETAPTVLTAVPLCAPMTLHL